MSADWKLAPDDGWICCAEGEATGSVAVRDGGVIRVINPIAETSADSLITSSQVIITASEIREIVLR